MPSNSLRMPRLASPQNALMFPDEVIETDYFAGGGGASVGLQMVTGRPVALAVNHSEIALSIHAANHPETEHMVSDVWEVDPRVVINNRQVGWSHFSPDCRHFSRSRGGTPVRKDIRGLAWCVTKVAATVRPRLITVENVAEMRTWGPVMTVTKNGKQVTVPDPDRACETFASWIKSLEDLGYEVEHRVLRAHDYGAPTKRERLFIIARCDGEPIVWPTPSHGEGKKAYRTAAECLDFSIDCPSVFLTRKEAREQGLKVNRPLAEATLRRVAAGVKRFVIDVEKPFVVDVPDAGFTTPFSVPRYGERPGQSPRCQRLDEPMSTIVTTSNQGSLVQPRFAAVHLAKHYTGVVGCPVDQPLSTITAIDHHSLVASSLVPASGADAKALSAARGVADFVRTYTESDVPEVIMVKGELMVDIGLRMLTPSELFRAQGFPADYEFTRGACGRELTKTEQIKLCGNSVPPQMIAAIGRANYRLGGTGSCAA